MQTSPRKKQLPGRMEALGLVLRQGIDNSSQELKHLAGLDVRLPRMTPPPFYGVVTFSSGTEPQPSSAGHHLPF